MYLAEILAPDLICLNVSARDKWELLDHLAELIMANPHLKTHPVFDQAAFHQTVVSREKERTTAIGHGCALPHARIPDLPRTAACLATLARPMDFEAPDGEPVRVVCLLLVPEEDPSLTLKVMAELSALVSKPDMRSTLEKSTSPEEVYELIRAHGEGTEHPVTAGIIMRKPFFDVYPDTPLTEATHLLQEYKLDAVSVVERDGTIVGEITFDLLCRLGMPEFFSQLRSVGFIKNFDPFESYFKGIKGAVARDVMSKSFAALPESATLLEVVFELTVRQHAKVYVVRDGKRVGVIDRSAVMSRVINF